MDKRKMYAEREYQDPFLKGNASPKHHWRQVNGETMETQSITILHKDTRKQT